MSGKGTIGKVIVLLLLILVLIFAGLFLFDYLGVINAKSIFSPLYSLVTKKPKTTGASKDTPLSGPGSLDEDELAKRLEALEITRQQIEKDKADAQALMEQNKQIAAELEEKASVIDDKEKSFQLILTENNDRAKNIRQIAIYAYNSKPEKAVANLLELDDQDVIEVFRATEVYAAELGKGSPVAYWLTLMPPERAGEIQRKMANSPAIVP